MIKKIQNDAPCSYSNLPPLITIEEEKELAQIISNGSDEEKESARKKFVESNLRLVITIAKNYEGMGLDIDDLVNEGNIGLMVAVDRFDPNKGAKFSTYAAWWIKQKIRRALGNKGSLIRVPIYLKQQHFNILKFIEQHKFEHNDEPSVEQISEKFNIHVDRVKSMLEVTAPLVNLDQKVGEFPDLTVGEFLEDTQTSTPYDNYDMKERRDNIESMILTLNPREQYIIRQRFGLGGLNKQTLEKIAVKFGVTRERIRQVEKIAMEKLRIMYHKKSRIND
jgi:RNA polymerase primary sigma factor